MARPVATSPPVTITEVRQGEGSIGAAALGIGAEAEVGDSSGACQDGAGLADLRNPTKSRPLPRSIKIRTEIVLMMHANCTMPTLSKA